MAEAKLHRLRLSDDDDGPDVVQGHKDLEEAIGLILGIDDKVEIKQAIFGTVRSDGGVFLIRYKDVSATGAADSAGIEFNDGQAIKKLCIADGKIGVYEYDSDADTWTLAHDYEEVVEPYLAEHTDVDFDTDEKRSGRVLGTETIDGTVKFVLKPALIATDGVDEFKDLSEATEFDNSGNLAHVGKLVGVKNENQLGPFTTGDPDETSRYGHFRALNKVLPVAGLYGTGGEWLVLDWTRGAHDSGDLDLDQAWLWQLPTSGIVFDQAGIYKIRLDSKKKSSSVSGAVMMKIHNGTTNPKTSSFPPVSKLWQPDAYWWEKGIGAPPADWALSKIKPIQATSSTSPASFSQTAFIVARGDGATFGISMATDNPAGITVDADLSIMRIQ